MICLTVACILHDVRNLNIRHLFTARRIVTIFSFLFTLVLRSRHFLHVKYAAKDCYCVSRDVLGKTLKGGAGPERHVSFVVGSSLRGRSQKYGKSWQDLGCQISLAQHCMPSPTVGQIRRASACVRRAGQFSDVKLQLLSIPRNTSQAGRKVYTLLVDRSVNEGGRVVRWHGRRMS